jgi:hypothetical protein
MFHCTFDTRNDKKSLLTKSPAIYQRYAGRKVSRSEGANLVRH